MKTKKYVKKIKEKLKLNLDPVLTSDFNDLKVLEEMIETDRLNSLLLTEDFDPSIFEDILEDIDPLDFNPQYYQKPKSKPLPTNKNWYI